MRLLPATRVAETPPHLPEEGDGFVERWKRTRAFLAWFERFACEAPAGAEDPSRLFVYVYPKEHAPAWEGRHSVGTTRGRRGMVFASDDPDDWGNVHAVLAHELMHALGAREHRERDGRIAHPEGYADPSRSPLHPQEKAEIMALGIPWSDAGDEALVESLDDVVVGLWTAKEIGWRE